MFGATIIGIGYTVLQIIVFVIFQIILKSDKYIVFEFYGDKVQSSYCYRTNFINFGVKYLGFLGLFCV